MAPPPPASTAGTVSPKTRKGIAEWPSQSEIETAEPAGSFGTQKHEVEIYPSIPNNPGQASGAADTDCPHPSSRPSTGAPLTGLANLAQAKASPGLGLTSTVWFFFFFSSTRKLDDFI